MIIAAVLTSLAVGQTLPAFRFHQAFSDNMVLQREPLKASISGWANAGDAVTIQIGDGLFGKTNVALADNTVSEHFGTRVFATARNESAAAAAAVAAAAHTIACSK